MRAAADEVLIRAGEVRVVPGLGRRALDPCSASRRDVLLPPGGLALRTRAAWAGVRVRRFASGFENDPVAVLGPHHSITVRSVPDGNRLPWKVSVHCYRPQP
jgi:hypothetical protein